jgi:hypothetical protein
MGQVVTFGKMVVQHFLPYSIQNVPIYGTLWVSSSIHITHERETKVPTMDDHIQHQQKVCQLLTNNLAMAQNEVKQQANQHRSGRHFNKGGWYF